ncbi:M23 family metallopeptidase [Flavobacteriales bacterium]|jgi:murein DD-endopeptidase MepM/ murein hydrolase activator NlpD|nr:M23 family metallopeptidase [Flavobacteriales bacterium]
MSNNYFVVLIFFVTVFISFIFLSSSSADKVEREFNKEYEASSFDFPIGKPNAEGYYNAQEFGENNHLGDDWNGISGGNTDYSDSIFSIANGFVTYAKDIKGGWGNVIRIKHLYKGKFYESLYAHCSNMFVNEGDWIKKGYHIGNIGDCNGMYFAHLHFEIRDSLEMPIGGGYSENNIGYLNPLNFIKNNRNFDN